MKRPPAPWRPTAMQRTCSFTISTAWALPVVAADICTLKNALRQLLAAVLILVRGACKARLVSLLLGIPRMLTLKELLDADHAQAHEFEIRI